MLPPAQCRGELQGDARLYMARQGILPKEFTDDVIFAFQQRRSRGDPGAERWLVENIVEALHDHALQHATNRPAVLCRGLFGRE